MTTFIITVSGQDEEYVEEILRAIPAGCREPVDISYSRPLPKYRKKRKASD